MAIIYSYQENEELLNSDRLVGTATTLHNGQARKVTKNFSLGQLKTFINGGDLILSNGGTSGPATLIDNVLNIPVYQGALTLTTTGSSGAATLIGNTLNIPQYGGTPPTPTLNQVLTAGNTSLTQIVIGSSFAQGLTLNQQYTNIGLTTAEEIYQTGISYNGYYAATEDLISGKLFRAQWSARDGILLNTYGSTGYIELKSDLVTTAIRTVQFPDASGTIALTSDLTGYVPTSRTLTINGTAYDLTADRSWSVGTVTSVGLSMPSAFTVASSPITGSGTIAVTGAGTVSQYVRGDGTLANFPNSTGGGASVNYYLNGSVSQGTFGGDTYYQMSKTPILGAGTNFIRTNGAGNGYIASFITDAGDPSFLNIPGGNWNLEFYFQSSASGGSPQFYGEIYKVSATNVFTLVASGSANPEGITNGTTVDQYFTSIPVPQTSLLITDRLAIRIYVITAGRTITLHTENGNLCEVLTTFTTGLTALNGLTNQVQFFNVGTGATNFNISSSGDTHTFNLLFNIRRNANNSSNNNINYNGYAVTGSAESSAVWTITRLTIGSSGSVTIGTATNVAWTNRESVIYT
jgi:hypothetical protein